MQNFGATNKEHYGMSWYFLEWSIGALIPEMSAHFNRSFETSKSTRDCLKANNAEYFNAGTVKFSLDNTE